MIAGEWEGLGWVEGDGGDEWESCGRRGGGGREEDCGVGRVGEVGGDELECCCRGVGGGGVGEEESDCVVGGVPETGRGVCSIGSCDLCRIISINLSLVTHILLSPRFRPCFCSSVLVKFSLRKSQVGLLSDGVFSVSHSRRASKFTFIVGLVDVSRPSRSGGVFSLSPSRRASEFLLIVELVDVSRPFRSGGVFS